MTPIGAASGRLIRSAYDCSIVDSASASVAGRHLGQYQGAGVVTALGLRLRQIAHKYRLPRAAVFGRNRFPLRSRFSPIAGDLVRMTPLYKTKTAGKAPAD